jgi:hypothetical protein
MSLIFFYVLEVVADATDFGTMVAGSGSVGFGAWDLEVRHAVW